MRRTLTPFGALLRGLAAGAIGAGVQNLFFRATARVAPKTPDVFQPPEPEQKSEMATHTVARRFVEKFMARGPLDEEKKSRGANLVHFGFGAAWGGLYGIVRESLDETASPLGMLAYSLLVWGVSDNLVLPAFRLAAWPNKYPLATHGFAAAAHVAYGLGVWSTYELMRPRTLAILGAMAWAAGARGALARRLPSSMRPVAGKVVDGIARLRALRPRVIDAVAEVTR